ncbi:non-ribosomal peptide synthetase [Chitinophaga sancti]|uniref:AMP-binding enzyme C-terminal domain-containing protein n=1 Tax=Chitinophaga sancti TaxID=1004 RepID=A0A1K1SS53_9BACT|nr:non-ribosomal peptide synthetase [Chitinophaga sancti]WQD64526.1 amino acid adenylation domain-containing protein [Chitinophaga sancti]WQG89849.1 amino acid adenylation domain-containing protein [Chitinophaga sancti]SFW87145.1 AMP-binding enzyme C-terminal domain-containing protein [Chitinophaga sancti]
MNEFSLQEFTVTSYWTDKIKQAGGAAFYSILPLEGTVPERRQYHHELPAEVAKAVIRTSREKDINIYKLSMAALYILLGKYSQRPDLLLTTGSVQLDAVVPASQPLPLFFAVPYEEEMTVKELLKQVHDELERNINRQHYNYAAFAELLDEQPELNEQAFAVAFSYEPLTAIHEHLFNAPLFFRLFREESRLWLQIDYNAAIYNTDYVQLLAHHLQRTLEIITTDLNLTIADINFITEEDKARLFGWFNDTVTSFQEQPVIEQFEQQALQTPDAVAVKSGDVVLTYRQLNDRANEVAWFLKHERGLQHQDKVSLMVNRSEKIIIGIIAILKAGGVYIPIDLSSPQDRVRFFMEDSGSRIVLTEKSLVEQTPDAEAMGYLAMEDIPAIPADNPILARDPHELVYMIYTSGTTGKPKGAMVHHLGLANHVSWFRRRFAITPADSTMLINSYSFDGCYSYIWATLTSGATLHVPNDSFFDPDKTLRYIKQEQITFLKMVPSTFGVLVNSATFDEDPEVCLSVRMLKQGGETINVKNLRKYFERNPHVELGNHYGATEATIGSVAWWITNDTIGDFTRQPVLGQPFDNQQVYVLNSRNELLPVGVPGEIAIGGVGVGKGYHRREELTARKFIDNPFRPGEKLYRTGDHGRWLPSGKLEFFGRIDNQVKIRGFRVELDEVAETLKDHYQVRDAIVLVYSKDGQDQLAAYFVTEAETPDITDIQEFMKGRLPDYMIPVYYIPLQRLPLTPNGKIDKRALPDAGDYRPQFRGSAVEPRTTAETQLKEIWEQLLDISGIGVTDNFFEIGGHSLKATQLIAMIHKQLRVSLPLKEVFLHPTIEEQAKLLESATGDTFTDITPVPQQADYEVSHAQKRMWLIAGMDAEPTAYNIPHGTYLEGNIDVAAFEKALTTLVARHEILRTVFVVKDGLPRQRVQTPAESGFHLEFKDLRNTAGKDFVAAEIAGAEAATIFDLAEGPLVRAVLLQLEDQRFMFLFTLHHIISDGWSTGVFFSDILKLYHAYTNNLQVALAPLHIQYKDFTAWQNALLASDAADAHRAYWLGRLGNDRPVLELPADFNRPKIMTFKGEYLSKQLPASVQNKLQQYAAANNLSLYMVLMGAVKSLLYRYTGLADLIVGTPVAGREHASLADQIGFYVNTLAIRTAIREGESFDQFVRGTVKDALLEGYEHQSYPFDQLIDDLQLERDMSRPPLFNVMVVMQNNTVARDGLLDQSGLRAIPFSNQKPVSKFDLTIDFEEGADGLTMGIEYYSDLFAEVRMQRMLEHLGNLIEAVSANPGLLIEEVEYLSAGELQEIASFAGTYSPTHPALTVHGEFEKQVAEAPLATAVVDAHTSYNYEDLNTKAGRLATLLQQHSSLQPQQVVMVAMSRSAEFVVAMLATLKAGGAYLPVEVHLPVDRLLQLLELTQAAAVITDDANIREQLHQQVPVIYTPDTEWEHITPAAPMAAVNGDSLAYIMFTSGSTGTPKGVMIEHRNIVSRLREQPLLHFSAQDVFLQTGSLSFDAATFEIWGPLLNGGCVHLLPLPQLLDPRQLAVALQTRAVSVAFFTTSWLNQLVDINPAIFRGMHRLYTGGEAMSAPHIRKLHQHSPELIIYNCYGPTEITAFATLFRVDNRIEEEAAIGYPMTNDLVYIMDKHQRIVPKGIPGELLLGGGGLSRGYINDGERTARQFIEHAGIRMYKTGDLVAWGEDGRIMFLGRLDDQVKIRGYRVEPDEVAAVMQTCAGVKEAVVVVHRKSNNEKMLAGYYTLTETGEQEDLRSFLAKVLPAYMVPASLIALDVMPLNANGKIDRKALPEPQPEAAGYVAPRNETETQLATIWERLLGISLVGIYDNFFALGGHSLLATRLISAIREEMQLQASPKDIFTSQTIAELAPVLTAAQNALPAITAYTGTEKVPLSFAQERLWFIDQLEGSVQYHMPVLLRINGKLNIGALELALRGLLERHEVLRTIITEEDGKAYQSVRNVEDWQLQIIRNPQYADQRLLHAAVNERVAQPFRLSADYMLKAWLMEIGQEEHTLLILMHHIATDGWSVGITIRELSALYNAYNTGTVAELPQLNVQYRDFALWQRRYFTSDRLALQAAYWKNQLADVAPLNLLTDFPRPAVQSTRGACYTFHIDTVQTQTLKQLSLHEDATLFMTLLTAFKVLLHRYTGQDDICVGAPIAGRTRQEVEGLIGFFVNTLALRTDLSNNPAFTTLLQQVKATTLSAYEHQELPFEKVVDIAGGSRELSATPLFQAMFALNNTPASNNSTLADLQLIAEDLDQTTAKVDVSFSLEESEDGIQGNVVYCTDLFTPDTIAQLVRHFLQLLEAISITPDAQIGALPMLQADELELVLHQFNNSTPGFAIAETDNILEMFAHQVAIHPDFTALVTDDAQVTYAELDRRSDALAYYLQQLGVAAGTLVPMCLERSIDMITGILAILKAGAAYLPIDPAYPRERIQYTVEDSGAAIMLTSSSCDPVMNLDISLQLVVLDTLQDLSAAQPLPVNHQAGNLAYVIYTSGSTGRPKGVLVEHRGVVNLVKGLITALDLRPGQRFLQFSSFGFDASCYEIFTSLLSGGCLVLPKQDTLLAADGFGSMVNRHKVEIVLLPPSYQHAIRENTGTIHTIISGGEALLPEDAKYFKEKGIRVYNAYGPTENTIITTLTDNPLLQSTVVIGPPVANVRVYVLDKYNNICPPRVAGEICAGGPGVARGYLNRPELTCEKFIADTFLPVQGGRCYRTGDLGRWLPSGDVEFLGRIDDQVKIRGYRIELGEINNVLQECALVKQAVVMARNNKRNRLSLVAYVVPVGEFNREAVTDFLRGRLPEYMIPSLVEMDRLPVTASGKIDKQALPAVEETAADTTTYTGPRNETEKALVRIWEELLQVPRVSIYDNFFELGGDSIISIQLVSRARRAGYILHPRDIFRHQHIAALATAVSTTREIMAEQGQLTGSVGLLPVQYWFFEQQFAAAHHFNQSILLHIDKSLDAAILNTVLTALAERHDMLRARYRQHKGSWMQEYGEAMPVVVNETATNGDEITAICERYQASLDIEAGPLQQCVRIETPLTEANNRLFIAVHHLVVDGVSWRIILEDMAVMLEAALTGTVLPAAAKTSSYRQWQDALCRYAVSPATLSELPYWEHIVNAYTPLPTDRKAPAAARSQVHTHTVKLPVTVTRNLLGKAQQVYNTGINDWLLAALARTISEWSGNSRVLITLEGHGREAIAPELDTTQTVGWFTNMYPLLLETGQGVASADLVRHVKEQLRALPAKGMGYGALRYLHPNMAIRESLRLPATDIIFNYLGQLDNITSNAGNLSIAAESTGESVGGNNAFNAKLEITVSVAEGQLYISWTFNPAQYNVANIEILAARNIVLLQELLDAALALPQPVASPSDFGLTGSITISQLDHLLRTHQPQQVYSLGPVQQQMLHASIRVPQNGTWLVQVNCDVTGADENLLQQAWNHVIANHSILRTAIYHELTEHAVQGVHQNVSMPSVTLHYENLEPDMVEAAVEAFLEQDKHTDFDLSQPPLMRIAYIHLPGGRLKMVWTLHHIILDGWSMSTLVDEWMKASEDLLQGRPLMKGTADNYEDYIRFTASQDQHVAAGFWQQHLKALKAPLWLPFAGTRADRNFAPGIFRDEKLLLDERQTAAISQFCQQHHITMNTFIQGVWAFLLYKYTRSRNIVYGVILTTRPAEIDQVERRVGPYINIIPLAAAISPAVPLIAWLQGLQDGHSLAASQPYISLESLQEITGIADLFDSVLFFENYPLGEQAENEDRRLQLDNICMHEHNNYLLSLFVGVGNELVVRFNYNSSLLQATDIAVISHHFQVVVQHMLRHPEGAVTGIRLTTAAHLKDAFANTGVGKRKRKPLSK